MSEVPFCTCTDHACPCHPVNHDRGCTPCIAKNLRQHEVPSCLFRAVSPDKLPEDADGRASRGTSRPIWDSRTTRSFGPHPRPRITHT